MKQNIFNVVKSLLRQNDKYIAEGGKLFKTVAYSDVMTMDFNLFILYLTDDDIREQFFKNINGTFAFYKWQLELKEFLPDSYVHEDKLVYAKNSKVAKINEFNYDNSINNEIDVIKR